MDHHAGNDHFAGRIIDCVSLIVEINLYGRMAIRPYKVRSYCQTSHNSAGSAEKNIVKAIYKFAKKAPGDLTHLALS